MRHPATPGKLPWGRSGLTYLDFFRGAPRGRLGDEERAPKGVWWLAGGRMGHGKQVPTVGELRARRRWKPEVHGEI